MLHIYSGLSRVGYIDCELNTFTHPISGDSVPVSVAVEREWLLGSLSQVEEVIKSAAARQSNVLQYTTVTTKVCLLLIFMSSLSYLSLIPSASKT